MYYQFYQYHNKVSSVKSSSFPLLSDLTNLLKKFLWIYNISLDSHNIIHNRLDLEIVSPAIHLILDLIALNDSSIVT